MSTSPVLGSLCTGYGGLDLGVLAALGSGRIAWCADPDPHVQQILAARMPDVPNLGDLRAINWATVEPVDVLVAGFPCQDISAAGRRVGIEKGERSGLWTDIVAGVRVLRPALFVVENVAALRWRNGGLHRVLGDLAEAGYDALWRSVRASDIGAPHRRERVFLLAWPRTPPAADAANAASARRRQPRRRRSSAPPSTWTSSQLARRGDRCSEAAAHADRDQPERHRGPQPLARPTREASSTQDQRQRDGHAVVHRGAVAPDPASFRREGLHALHPRRRTVPVRPVSAAGDGQFHVPADPASDRRNQGLPSAARLQRRPDAALGDHLAAVPQHAPSHVEAERGSMGWGDYAPAVRRWEHLLGRPAPHPTQPGQHGGPVLAPVFVEHLMGLPHGWVTAIPLPRTAQLRALGNGVVPAQAAHAVSLLLTDLTNLVTDQLPGTTTDTYAA